MKNRIWTFETRLIKIFLFHFPDKMSVKNVNLIYLARMTRLFISLTLVPPINFNTYLCLEILNTISFNWTRKVAIVYVLFTINTKLNDFIYMVGIITHI